MTDFEHPMTWMKQVFTKTELKTIEKDVEKLINEEKEAVDKKYKAVDKNHIDEVFRDKIIALMHDSTLDLPFHLTVRGGVIEQLKKIKKNLFIAYPYYFDAEQFVMLAKSVNDAGFNIRVDPYASRGVGINLRVVIWKPYRKDAKKDKSTSF